MSNKHQRTSLFHYATSNLNMVNVVICLLVVLDYLLLTNKDDALQILNPVSLLFSCRLVAWSFAAGYILLNHAVWNSVNYLVLSCSLPDMIFILLGKSSQPLFFEFAITTLSCWMVLSFCKLLSNYQKTDLTLELAMYASLLLFCILHNPVYSISIYWEAIASAVLQKNISNHLTPLFTSASIVFGRILLPLLVCIAVNINTHSLSNKSSLSYNQWLQFNFSDTTNRLALALLILSYAFKAYYLALGVKVSALYWLLIGVYSIVTFIPAVSGLSAAHCYLAHHQGKSDSKWIYQFFWGLSIIVFLLLREVFAYVGLIDKYIDVRKRFQLQLPLQH